MNTRALAAVHVMLAAAAVASSTRAEAQVVGGAASRPSTPPSDASTTRPSQPAKKGDLGRYHDLQRAFYELIPRRDLSNAALRDLAAPKAIPILLEKVRLCDKPANKSALADIRRSDLALLYLLKDPGTVSEVERLLASGAPDDQVDGKLIQLYSMWHGAGEDPALAMRALDAMEAFCREHSAETKATRVLYAYRVLGVTPAVKDRATEIIIDVMTDKAARSFAASQAAAKKACDEAGAGLHKLVGKPLVISGRTADGADLSTATWKGKVVLVDFWATWCAPCKAELPHVKSAYAKYHGQGFEVIGISNDFAAKPLLDYSSANGMPWPELFDETSAAERKFHPFASQLGITSIPVMLLIDKKGIVRSVDAEAEIDALLPKLLAE